MTNSTKKIAVTYKSHYGTTKKYAEWIAEALDASLFEATAIKTDSLMDYDVVVHGGGLYAGGILGSKLVADNPCKALVIFSVGLADPKSTDFTEILNKNFTKEKLSQLKAFHLRGGIDYKELNIAHKFMMWMVKKRAEKIPTEERGEDDRILLETYGSKLDFMDKDTIIPLIEYIQKLPCHV